MINTLKFAGLMFVIVALCLIAGYHFGANAYQVPEDAVIKVFDKNGKQIGHMSRKHYKVVKIEKNKKVIEQRKADRKYKKKHNTLILHAGHGRTGEMRGGHNGNQHVVTQKEGMVFGATYCKTRNTQGVCFTGYTNKTFTFGIKKDY